MHSELDKLAVIFWCVPTKNRLLLLARGYFERLTTEQTSVYLCVLLIVRHCYCPGSCEAEQRKRLLSSFSERTVSKSGRNGGMISFGFYVCLGNFI